MKAVLLALGIAATLAIALASTATAQSATYSEPIDADLESMDELTSVAEVAGINATVSTTSTATAEIEPDKVIILLAVETVDEDVSTAIESNSETVRAVLDALLEAGVNENETSTSGFVVYPNYDYNFTEFGYPGETGEITSYTAANTIQIESNNLEDAGSWIDAAIQAGANRVDNVLFTLSDELMEETKADLIVQAVDKARSRAGMLASALDMEIAGLKEAFLEDYDFFPSPYEVGYSFYGPSGVPLIPPKQTVTMTVHLTYFVE